MKSKMMLLTMILLITVFVSQVAFAANIEDASDYFTLMYISDGDLGDENVPMALLYGGVALVAISAIIVHQKRRRIQ